MAPRPATTSSSRAMMEPAARRLASIVRCVVASCGVWSSSRACSSNASMRWLFQSMASVNSGQWTVNSEQLSTLWQSVEVTLGLVQKPLCLVPLLLQALDDMRGSLGEKAGVVELAVGGLNNLFGFAYVLFQALALGGHVDGALVDHLDIEAGF